MMAQSLFDTLKAGPKTTEFWAAIVGSAVGLFAVKEGIAALDVLTGLSPTLAYIFGRSGVKVAQLVGSAREAASQVGRVRDAARQP